MSGTGQFRNVRGALSRSGTAREHLGDRLAAFVDGELGDDARDRVLSHLASCDPCKAEAEEQRRLKNAVADALPPALSDGLLARLQGLPGCDHDDLAGPGPDTPCGLFGRGGPGVLDSVLGGPSDGDRSPARGGERRSFLTPAEPLAGFPIHDFTRPAASRSRRLAFAAAGAFSLAALAIGAAVPLEGGSAVTGAADPAPGTAATPQSMRQVADQRSAEAVASPAPDAVEQSLMSPRGGRSPLGATGPAAPAARPLAAGAPGPSALPLAPWTAAGASPAASVSATASPAPVVAAPRAPVPSTPPASAPAGRAGTPVPLPQLTGEYAERLPAGYLGGHPY
ncbi:zf-HC2 domain-containing protein [Streptomyces sp. SL13]|uniref:Zf-HC2 domain-containing protein n=1 Tax=Streptantibioticus silvisoli TaxID=2705255 RepID=A0AA90H347_9ACTN|nr:zf-HC2 domain-containing protein [Streptantibioticus silvisoli]MDI5963892.1 zf-HC2 domain-containing protein [Streptantibioticus silvisoli]MDI5970441.1 zf-HC2 domain-containing protein [Streptantibioticus silvisoli]